MAKNRIVITEMFLGEKAKLVVSGDIRDGLPVVTFQRYRAPEKDKVKWRPGKLAFEIPLACWDSF